MKIETITKESYPALILRGDFETDAADSFLAAVEPIAAGDARLMVSFRYVKYINSTALGAVMRARSNCKAKGGDLIILQPSRLSREIITKMGLEGVLRIFDDESEAASYLGGNAQVADVAPKSSASPDEDEVSVRFLFDDERSTLIPGKGRPGKSRHGVGILASVDATGLKFRWDPKRYDADPSLAATLFRAGSSMHNKLQLKLIRKEFFEGDSMIENLTQDESGAVLVTARWSRIAEADREALQRHENELSFLKQQTDETPAQDS